MRIFLSHHLHTGFFLEKELHGNSCWLICCTASWGSKAISWKFQEVRGLCTWPLESIRRAYSLSLFVCYPLIHIETNMEFFVCLIGFWCLVCWVFPPPICCFFLFCSPCWENILQRPRVSTPQVILNSSQTSQKGANLICSEVLSCQVANCRISQM